MRTSTLEARPSVLSKGSSICWGFLDRSSLRLTSLASLEARALPCIRLVKQVFANPCPMTQRHQADLVTTGRPFVVPDRRMPKRKKENRTERKKINNHRVTYPYYRLPNYWPEAYFRLSPPRNVGSFRLQDEFQYLRILLLLLLFKGPCWPCGV
jgi:hypothetical protein